MLSNESPLGRTAGCGRVGCTGGAAPNPSWRGVRLLREARAPRAVDAAPTSRLRNYGSASAPRRSCLVCDQPSVCQPGCFALVHPNTDGARYAHGRRCGRVRRRRRGATAVRCMPRRCAACGRERASSRRRTTSDAVRHCLRRLGGWVQQCVARGGCRCAAAAGASCVDAPPRAWERSRHDSRRAARYPLV